MHIRSQSKNLKLFISIHPMYARMQITSAQYPTPSSPSALTMLLRKHLEGAYLESVKQIELDRIVDLTFVGTNELKDIVKYHIFVEIMGKHSNIIITHEDYRIIDCLKRVSLSMNTQRILQPGAYYQLPPMVKKDNPFFCDFKLTDNLTLSKRKQSLNARFPIRVTVSGIYTLVIYVPLKTSSAISVTGFPSCFLGIISSLSINASIPITLYVSSSFKTYSKLLDAGSSKFSVLITPNILQYKIEQINIGKQIKHK